MHQYKILNYYFYHYQYIIYVIVYIKILPTIRVTMYWYMMEEIRIPIHKQMLQLTYIKYIETCDAKWDLLQLDNDEYVF